ncbi:unnamed protein product [Somion occarium]|uniref:MYND-type domain-containing protein n=1 Tax=Somion occarium TaxID=3059160 RepID=A0ABP1CGR8_9APHY
MAQVITSGIPLSEVEKHHTLARRLEGETPSFNNLVENSPGEVAETIHRMHVERDKNRFLLAASLSYYMESASMGEADWIAFLASDLPNTLMDIALDDGLYHEVEESERAQMYLDNILSALAVCLFQFDDSTQQQHEDCAISLVRKAPSLFSKVWDKRGVLLSLDPCGPEIAMSIENPVNILSNYMDMYACQHKRYPSIDDGCLGDLLVRCWILCEDAELGEQYLECLFLILDPSEGRPIDMYQLRCFIFRTLGSSEHAIYIVRRMLDVLLNEEVKNEHLCKVLTLLSITLVHCPPIHGVLRRDMSVPTLIQCLANVARLLQGAADDEIASAMKLINESQLIPMESQLYLQALRDNDQSFIPVLDTILDFYSTLGQTEARAQTNSAELKALRSHVTRVLAPTLQKLRALPSSLRRTRAINKWTNLAKALELRETSWPEDITIDDSSHSHSRRCHWHDCMCSHTDPAHSIRVCKGCWQVFYCSRQCQRSDWTEGGHRITCRRYHS